MLRRDRKSRTKRCVLSWSKAPGTSTEWLWMRWNFLFTSTERVLAFSMLALMFLAWIEFFGYTLITTEMPSRSPASRKRTTCLTVMLRGLGVQDIGMRLLISALEDLVILGLYNWSAGFPFKRKSPLTGLFFRLFVFWRDDVIALRMTLARHSYSKLYLTWCSFIFWNNGETMKRLREFHNKK